MKYKVWCDCGESFSVAIPKKVTRREFSCKGCKTLLVYRTYPFSGYPALKEKIVNGNHILYYSEECLNCRLEFFDKNNISFCPKCGNNVIKNNIKLSKKENCCIHNYYCDDCKKKEKI